jgi:hypothetical protein
LELLSLASTCVQFRTPAECSYSEISFKKSVVMYLHLRYLSFPQGVTLQDLEEYLYRQPRAFYVLQTADHVCASQLVSREKKLSALRSALAVQDHLTTLFVRLFIFVFMWKLVCYSVANTGKIVDPWNEPEFPR